MASLDPNDWDYNPAAYWAEQGPADNIFTSQSLESTNEGGGATTTTDTTGNIFTLPQFVVNEPRDTSGGISNIFNPNQIIGADAVGGRETIGELTGAVPGISSGTSPGTVGVGSGVSKTVQVGETQKTLVFDDVINQQLNDEIARMRSQGITTSDPQYSIRLEQATDRALGIWESMSKDLSGYTDLEPQPGQTGPGQKGPPLVLPIPGISPATAAILTAAGLIFSGGKIARLDPNKPVESVVGAVQGVGQTGQNVVDVATGKTDLQTIWSGGTGTGGGTSTTSGGTTPTGTTPTGTAGLPETPSNISLDPLHQQILAGAVGAAAARQGQQDEERAKNVLNQTLGAAATAQNAPTATQTATPTTTAGGDTGINAGTGIFVTPTTSTGTITQTPSGGYKSGVETVQEETKFTTPGGFISHTPDQGVAFGKQTGTATESEQVSTTSCPSPETLVVLENKNLIPAGDLKIGDRVWTQHEHTLLWGSYPVTQVKIVKDYRIKLEFDGGDITCSQTHKFNNGPGIWMAAGDLKPLDVIQGRILRKISDVGDGPVVVITVDGAHTYIAGSFLAHNKAIGVMPSSTATPSTTTPSTTTPTPSTFIINPISTGYTLPTAGTPVQRNLYQEASTTTQALGSPMQRAVIGTDAQGRPIYGNVPVDPITKEPMTVSQGIASGYGGLARGMTAQDITNLLQSIGAQTGTPVTGGYQAALTTAANEQTAAANTALRAGNIKDAETLFARAQALRTQANPQLYGETGALPQFTTAAQNQVARDVAALRQAEAGQLTQEQIRNAQQAAREAYAARGQVFSQGAAAQEVLNRANLIQQQQQLARQNLAQSMGQLGGAIGYQTANIFDPFATTLGQQYGMQTQNIGMNQALYNQAMGLTSGAGGYGFAQQMINPFSGYAQDVYGTNVNALNAAQIQAANRQAALEAAKMGQTGAYAQALGGLIASGGLGQIQSGITGGIQGVIDLLSGKWPTR